MNRLYNLLKSFKFAIRGITFCTRHEKNMRIHIIATIYVAFFSLFYDFTRSEVILLIMICMLVMAFEVINTSIEVIVDKISPEYSPLAKIAKDVAAGAVLLSACMAAIVGIVLFFDIDRIMLILKFIFTDSSNCALFIGFSLIALIFINSGKKRTIKGKIKND